MTQLEERIAKVEEEIGSLNTNTNEINKKVDRLLVAVIGDDLGVGKGIIGKIIHLEEYKVPDLEKRLTKVETFQNKMIWMAAGAGIAGGITVAKLMDFIQGATP